MYPDKRMGSLNLSLWNLPWKFIFCSKKDTRTLHHLTFGIVSGTLSLLIIKSLEGKGREKKEGKEEGRMRGRKGKREERRRNEDRNPKEIDEANNRI